MVPFVKAIVTSVDIAAGVMDLNPPTGLFEDIVDDGPDETYTSAPATES
jgi:16S rRNA processing protein RimM